MLGKFAVIAEDFREFFYLLCINSPASAKNEIEQTQAI